MAAAMKMLKFDGVRCGFRQVEGYTTFAGPGGQSSFLQKRMAKNTKYFDSGDYQVYKPDGRCIKTFFSFPDGPSEGQRKARLAKSKVGRCPSSRPGAILFTHGSW